MAQYRNSNPSLRHRDPIDVLDEMLERYEGAQDALASIASSTAHAATRVGAIRTSLDALRMQTDLLIGVGVLPRDLSGLVIQHDTRRTVKAILDVLDRHQVEPSVHRDILAAIDRRDAEGIRTSLGHRDNGQIIPVD